MTVDELVPIASMADALAQVKFLFEFARVTMETRGVVIPAAVLAARIDPKGVRHSVPFRTLLAPMFDGQPTGQLKQKFAQVLKKLISEYDAVGVMMMAMGDAEWAVGEPAQRHRSRAVLVTMEHRHFGNYIWLAPMAEGKVGEEMRLDRAVTGFDGEDFSGEFGGKMFGLLPERWMN